MIQAVEPAREKAEYLICMMTIWYIAGEVILYQGPVSVSVISVTNDHKATEVSWLTYSPDLTAYPYPPLAGRMLFHEI